MDALIGVLNNVPAVLRPFLLPLAGAILTLMGLMAMASIGNPGMRTTIKEHFVWLVLGGAMVGGGVALASGLFGALGIGG